MAERSKALLRTTLRLASHHDKLLAENAKRLEMSKAELARIILIRELDAKRTLEQQELIDRLSAHEKDIEAKLATLNDALDETKRYVARAMQQLERFIQHLRVEDDE